MHAHARSVESQPDRSTDDVGAFSPSVAAWFRLAVIYLLVGVVLAMAMGASGNFALRSVHSHVNLMGWTTLALAGVIYGAFPLAGRSRLAKVHFWLYNLALPPMLGALAAMLLGNPGAVPVLVGAEVVAFAGVLTFVVNVLLNVKRSPAAWVSPDGQRAARPEASRGAALGQAS